MSDKKRIDIYTVVLMILGILVSTKMIFAGVMPDEEYQLTMAYRFANGDDMFHYSWDTIQTSSFIATFFTRVYLLFHNTDSIVIFQRACGIIIQFFVSLSFYKFIKSMLDKTQALIISFALFAFFPKMIASAEFANMLQWFTILMVITLGVASNKYNNSHKLPVILIIVSALLLCGAILSQACFILVPIMIISLCLLFPDNKFVTNLVFFATCFITGLTYVLVLIVKLGMSELLSAVSNILSGDNTHASGLNLLGQSIIITFLKDSFHIFYLLVIVFLASYVISLVVSKVNKTAVSLPLIKLLTIFISGIYTFCQWFVVKTGYDGFKLFIPVCILWAIADCIIVYKSRSSDYKKYLLPFVGLLISIGVFVNVLLISNVPMINNLSFLSTGVIWSLVIFSLSFSTTDKYLLVSRLSVILIAFIIFSGAIFTIPSSPSGNTVFSCTSRIVDGPAKNTFTSRHVANVYTKAAREFTEFIPSGSNVLIVSNCYNNTLLNYCYLMNDVSISHYSVNSTPTFSQKLEEYWLKYPEKNPDVILFNNSTYSIWEFDWIRLYTQNYWTYKDSKNTEIFEIYYH